MPELGGWGLSTRVSHKAFAVSASAIVPLVGSTLLFALPAFAQEDVAGYVGRAGDEPVAWNAARASGGEPTAWQPSGGREPVAWNAAGGASPDEPVAWNAPPQPAAASAATPPIHTVALAPATTAAPAPARQATAPATDPTLAPAPSATAIAGVTPPPTPVAEAPAPAAPASVPPPAYAALPVTAPVATGWSLDANPGETPPPAGFAGSYGPVLIPTAPPPAPEESRYRYARSFGDQFNLVKWEVAGIAAWMTAINTYKVSEVGVSGFHWQNEGWFGKDTTNLGIDKLTHAFNTYWLADLLTSRIQHKTGDRYGGAVTGAVLASSLMIYSELWDAHKKSSGFSYEDVIANTVGATFSAIRNTVPGMKDKIDFRLLLIPNSSLYTFEGKGHYAQQRYLLALTLAGFDAFKKSPLRYVELQGGYYAKGFTREEQEKGDPLRRRLFFGVALNLKELIFPSPQSRFGRAAASVLDYIQVPYTGAYVPVTK